MANSNLRSLEMSAAFEKSKQAQSKRRSKVVVIGCIIGLVMLLAICVAAGVIVSNNKKETSKSSASSGDPSNFKKDKRFHRSFYGIAYTPEGSVPDYGCSNSLDSVIKDMQILSQLTGRIRLYGADCNQIALVLEAIKVTKVEMQVFLGNYVVDGDPGAYERQRDVIKQAIQKYGTDHIAGITVGNEFMLNYVTKHKSLDPNDAIGNEGAAILKANIEDTRQMLDSLNLEKHIPVGNSDAGSFFNTQILETIEYGMSNVHAWFANTTAEGAASWVNTFFDNNNVKPAAALPNNPKMYIAETGWPSDSKDAGNANNGVAEASVPNLQTFLDTFVCQANAAGTGYFYFELVDEEWKDKKYGGVEGHWGLLNKDRTLKDINIPNCPSP